MLKLFSAAALAVAMTTSALAGDLPVRSNHFVYPAPVHNWSGVYIGINGGYASGTASAPGISWDSKGGTFGATIGYNWQGYNSPLVLGLEADANWMSATGSPVAGVNSKQSNFYDLRARIGYAFDRFMPYLTGGVAMSKGSISVAGLGSDSHTHIGSVFGAGAELALDKSWSVKGEYLRAGFGEKDYTIAGTSGGGKFNNNIVRAGLNYRF